MSAPSPHEFGARAARGGYLLVCVLVFAFLLLPLVVLLPLSFNAQPYLSFTPGMLRLEADAFSLRWYETLFTEERWARSFGNSLLIAAASTLLSAVLGTVAALGLSHPAMPARGAITALLISPMIVPVIVTAAGVYAFYARIGLTDSHLGIVLAHTVLGAPFVVITVSATLTGFDRTLIRAGLMLGATPWRVFRSIVLPLILPGVLAGALFAFLASFDEIAIVLFIAPSPDHYTVPREMWSGIREQISPAILAMATLLILSSTAILLTVEALRRRSEARLAGKGDEA